MAEKPRGGNDLALAENDKITSADGFLINAIPAIIFDILERNVKALLSIDSCIIAFIVKHTTTTIQQKIIIRRKKRIISKELSSALFKRINNIEELLKVNSNPVIKCTKNHC